VIVASRLPERKSVTITSVNFEALDSSALSSLQRGEHGSCRARLQLAYYAADRQTFRRPQNQIYVLRHDNIGVQPESMFGSLTVKFGQEEPDYLWIGQQPVPVKAGERDKPGCVEVVEMA
jgi:hypothetical protein